MRTNIEIDDGLMQEAMEAAGTSTKTTGDHYTFSAALKDLVQSAAACPDLAAFRRAMTRG